MEKELLVIGHRGAMGYEPENTLASFRKAIDLGADAIELDVYFLEGHLVVFHDETLERTTNGQGLLLEQNFTRLRSLDAGHGEKIPTLTEVFALINGRVPLNIELKGPDTAAPVVDFISGKRLAGLANEMFLVSSFNRELLVGVRQLDPHILLGVLVDTPLPDHLDFADELNAYAINSPLATVDKSLVSEAHDRGLKVFVYTVDEANDMKRMAELGADGVFSNYPDRVAGVRGKKKNPGWL